MALSIAIPDYYGWILFEIVLISFQIWWTGITNNPLRDKLFDKAFYEKHFPEWKSNPKFTMDSGYPDNGQGRISDKLSDKDWFRFNNAQRAHYNYLEGIASIMSALLIAGLYTRYAVFIGLAYIIGREMYTQGYKRSGSTGRLIGVGIVDLSLFALWGISFYYCFNLGGGIVGLQKLFAF